MSNNSIKFKLQLFDLFIKVILGYSHALTPLSLRLLLAGTLAPLLCLYILINCRSGMRRICHTPRAPAALNEAQLAGQQAA